MAAGEGNVRLGMRHIPGTKWAIYGLQIRKIRALPGQHLPEKGKELVKGGAFVERHVV